MNRCSYCGQEVKENCTWNQGRCPHQSRVESSADMLLILGGILIITLTMIILI